MKAYTVFGQLYKPTILRQTFETHIAGSRAVGRDGVRIQQFKYRIDAETELIHRKVTSGTYRFSSYKEKLISKGATKTPRQISIPTFRDRLTLRTLNDLLTSVFSDDKSKSPHYYIKRIWQISEGIGEGYSFLRIDIKSYYPSIPHDQLLKAIKRKIRKKEIIQLISSAIKTPTGKKNATGNENKRGIPQGLSISNILSSIYLSPLDEKYENQFHYFRYVDDILVLCKSTDAISIYESIRNDLLRMGLNCHPIEQGNNAKTGIFPVSDGVDYLGYNITDTKIAVRQSSYRRMMSNILKVLTSYKYAKQKNVERLVWKLNIKISGCIVDGKRYGWMHFFSQTTDISQLKALDAFVEKCLQRYNVNVGNFKVKRFTRAYHEIRYNADNTSYIPIFENYDDDYMVRTICLLTGRDPAVVQTWDLELIKAAFWKLISRELSQLEKDLMEVFS